MVVMTVSAPASRSVRPRRAAAVVVALLAALGVVALWWLFVTTPPGQRVEELAMEGSAIGRWRLVAGTQTVLDVVSVPFLALVALAGAAVAAARRRWFLAAAVPVMVGGANLTTQVLKYAVFSRPDLEISATVSNTLPSGHTTVAGSVAAVAVLVVPPRWRWAAAVAGWGYAGGTGLATIINGWHRASDVLAGLLVVLAWAALTLAVVGPAGPDAGHRATRATSTLLLVGAACAGAFAAAALALTWATTATGTSPDRPAQLVAYGGAGAGVVALTCLAGGVMLRLCTVPSPRRGRVPRPA